METFAHMRLRSNGSVKNSQFPIRLTVGQEAVKNLVSMGKNSLLI